MFSFRLRSMTHRPGGNLWARNLISKGSSLSGSFSSKIPILSFRAFVGCPEARDRRDAGSCQLIPGGGRREVFDKFIGGYEWVSKPVNESVPDAAAPAAGRHGHRSLKVNHLRLLEIRCVLATAFHKCGQATKGVWWMPRCAEAMKDAAGCDKPRRAVKQALTLGSPNGATRHDCASRSCHRRLNA